jgi:hypothetical protein
MYKITVAHKTPNLHFESKHFANIEEARIFIGRLTVKCQGVIGQSVADDRKKIQVKFVNGSVMNLTKLGA